VIHANAAMLKDEQGQFAGFIGTITDVTRLQQAEQVTRNLGSIMESFQDAIIVFTLDGVILNWNRAAERIYGYSAAEVIGRLVMNELRQTDEVAYVRFASVYRRFQEATDFVQEVKKMGGKE